MAQSTARRRIGRFEYDPATARWLVVAMVIAAIILGALAFTYRGSPRMEDTRKLESGVTSPNPTEVSPAPTRPEEARRTPSVIASVAKQSRAICAALDCFVAYAPRNDVES